jgi:hypothetical protein
MEDTDFMLLPFLEAQDTLSQLEEVVQGRQERATFHLQEDQEEALLLVV